MRLHRRIPRCGRQLFNNVLYITKAGIALGRPLVACTTDKEYAKIFIAGCAGPQYVVPTLAVIREARDIWSYEFPPRCCIKPTHLSGCVIFRLAGEAIDRGELFCWFKENHYRQTGELNYRELLPGVIVEPLLFGSTNLLDYKVFCYSGESKLIQIDLDRHTNHRRAFYGSEWIEQEYSLLYPKALQALEHPSNLDQMLTVCRVIAQYFLFVRLDLYREGADIYIGEVTHCHGSATEQFIPRSAEHVASRIIFGSQ